MTYFQAKYEEQVALAETLAEYYKAAQEAIERVREVHYGVIHRVGEEPWCAECTDPYPCPTIQALDGEQ